MFNFYNRVNPIAMNFNKEEYKTGSFQVPIDKNGSPVLIPTEISMLGMVPSISYHFRF